nr:hypothetical protein [Tanacetum cinerariifolium]
FWPFGTYVVSIERGFLSSGGKGVKQKKGANTVNSVTNKENKDDDSAKDRVNEATLSNFATHPASANEEDNVNVGIGVSTDSDDNMNADTSSGGASAVQEGVTPSVVDMTDGVKKQNSLDDNTVLESFSLLSTPITTEAGSTPSKSSYANVTGKPSGKKLNIRTLFTPGEEGGILVVANYVRNTWGKYGLVRSMFSSSTGLFSFQFSSMDGLDAMLENDPWFIRNNPLILRKWHSNENVLKEDVNNIPVWVNSMVYLLRPSAMMA